MTTTSSLTVSDSLPGGAGTRMETGMVSVIIRTYNRADRIGRAIKSALAQDYPQTKVIVVDDGSTDNTGEVVRQFTSVEYIHQENGGVTAARFTGLRHATGEFVAFLDSDDEWAPGYLTRMVAAMREQSTVLAVCDYRRIEHFKGGVDAPSNVMNSRLLRELKATGDPGPHRLSAEEFRALAVETGVGPSSCVVMRRDAVVGRFQDHHRLAWDDMLMFLEIAFDDSKATPREASFLPECLMIKHNQDGVSEGEIDQNRFMIQRVHVFWKFLGWFGSKMPPAQREPWELAIAKYGRDLGYCFACYGSVGKAMGYYYKSMWARPSADTFYHAVKSLGRALSVKMSRSGDNEGFVALCRKEAGHF